MTQLMVSVRNASEARIALSAGVRVLDIKEPRLGALGRADDRVIREICSAVPSDVALSVALGELLVDTGFDLPRSLARCSFAKIGLAGCRGREDWLHLWKNALAKIPLGTTPVAVIYADVVADVPEYEEILEYGHEFGCQAALLDTYDKDSGGLLQSARFPQIERFVSVARSLNMTVALAGGLDKADVARLTCMKPDILAVRGAACSGGRKGPLCAERVSELMQIVESSMLAAY